MGIIAVQQWKSLLRYRCVRDGWDFTWNKTKAPDTASPVFAGTSLQDNFGDDRTCKPNSTSFEFGGHLCDWGYSCVDIGENPFWSKLSFDNIGVTSLTLFTGLTLEGWSETMYHTMDATTYFAAFFWVVLIVFGSFFVLNLTIVIITEAFEQKQREQKEAAFQAIDKDGTGELDRDEVRMLLEKKRGRPISEEELDKAFSAMDKDGGGTVSLEEFLAYDIKTADILVKKRATVTGFRRDIQKLVDKIAPVRAACDFVSGGMGRMRESLKTSTKSRGQQLVYQIVAPAGEFTWMPLGNLAFRTVVLGAIVLNTCTLAAEHHGQPENMTDILHICNIAFTTIFTIE
eukprot:Sspe_Gene.25611::Locus_10331_Transcript_1_1_Confidence_1.000_Length_2018::g.25611::m.25611